MSEMHADLKAAQQRIQVLERNLADAQEAGKRLAKQAISAERERDALTRDAERYRWIRGGSRIGVKWCELYSGGPALDEAIDSTMNALPSVTAKARFDRADGHEEPDPIERLRFFCSQAMSGQDWLDVEKFFDDVIAERDALAAKLAELEGQEPVQIDEPDYHWEAMGCGLEDRNITDRYEAMKHGWDCAIDRMLEQISEPLFARPVPAEPVNARLLEALLYWRDECSGAEPSISAFSRMVDEAIAAAESAPKAVRLTDEEIIGIRQVLAGWDCNTPWSQTIALSRAIETAVLRKNGLEVSK